jgi:hypothetical protein
MPLNSEQETIEKNELDKVMHVLNNETDPLIVTIRTHLYAETLLERLICFGLPRGHKITESNSFSFSQKLLIVESLDILADTLISSLKNLNKLRNQCAHELDKKISDTDITRIGSPLGKDFTKMKRESGLKFEVLLHHLMGYILGGLTAHCHFTENKD